MRRLGGAAVVESFVHDQRDHRLHARRRDGLRVRRYSVGSGRVHDGDAIANGKTGRVGAAWRVFGTEVGARGEFRLHHPQLRPSAFELDVTLFNLRKKGESACENQATKAARPQLKKLP